MKLLAAIVAAATVCAMSVSAFAATVTTTTSYDGDNVTVTTTVTGASEGEEVAYMVKKTGADTLNNETIYYIDQKTAGAGGVVAPFSFTMAKSKVTGAESATVLAGTTSTAANASNYTVDGKNGAVINVVETVNCTVTYTVGAGGKVFVKGTSDVALGGVAANGEKTGEAGSTITFVVIPDAGKKLAGDITLTGGCYVYEVPNAETATINFTFEDAVGEATVVASGEGITIDLDAEKPTITAIGKATGAFTEAGLKIGNTEFKALGFGTDGAFMVTVIEDIAEGEGTAADATINAELYIR